MRLHSLFARRPSVSLVISIVALFASLGGVGYAAIQIPNNSVGTSQLRNNAVTGNKVNFLAVGFRKIQLGAVGAKRINTSQVQVRVNGTCAGNSAIAAIDNEGNAQCTPTTPKEFGNSASATAVTTSSAIQTLSLPTGSSYLVSANPQISVSGTTAGSQVEVDCTLSINPGDSSTTQTRSVTFQASTHDPQLASVALTIPAPAVANGSSAAVTCSQTATAGTPTTTVATAINAIQTSSNS